MSHIDPDVLKKMVENPDMSKFIQPGITDRKPETVNNQQTVNFHYDALLKLENCTVDKETLPKLQDWLQKSYEYTTKQMSREARKSGYRGR